MPTKAYSYIRFSTPEQAKGHSIRRQEELSAAYAEEHGLELDNSLKMTDKGISGYKGDNINKGKLGFFIKKVDEGVVLPGSYLLVESLDRLSRDRVSEALRLFLSILDKGIVIVTLSDGKKYDNEHINDIDLIISLLIMSRAHEESATKGKRVKAAWDQKKREIRDKKLTKWSPKWVYLPKDRKKFIVIEERAKRVNEIFKWSANGLGTSLIIKRLERLGIEPWDMGQKGMTGKRPAKKWYMSYVQRLLHNRAVLGEYRLRRSDLPEGFEVIYDYYPKIVSEELFYRVKEARKSRDVNRGGRGAGPRGATYSNLFSGIAFCGYSIENNMGIHHCAGNMVRMTKVNKGKKDRYLQCSRLKDGNSGCELCRKMWPYDKFETSFLIHVRDVDASVLTAAPDEFEREIDNLKKTIQADKGRLLEIHKDLKKITDVAMSKDQIPNVLIIKMNDLENEEITIKKRLDEWRSNLKAKEHEYEQSDQKAIQLENLIDQMYSLSGDKLFDFRLQLSELLKSSITLIEMYPTGKVIDNAFIEKVKNELGDDASEVMLKQAKQTKKFNYPFFIVVYKSGHQRIVVPDTKDPTKLDMSVKWDESGPSEILMNWDLL